MNTSSSLPAVVPILLIGFVCLLTPALTPKTVQFGVRIPAERVGDAAITSARRGYRIGTTTVTAVACLTAYFVAAGTAARLSGIVVELVGTFAVYLMARSHVTAAKHAGRWFEGRKQVAVAETALRTRPEPFPWAWALPAVAIVIGTALLGALRYSHMPDRLVWHYDGSGHPTSYTDKTFASAFALVGVQIAATALQLTLTWVTFRSKTSLDAQDPHAAERQRRFIAAMARCLLGLTAAIDVTLFFAALAMWDVVGSTGWFPVLLLTPTVLATIALIAVAVRLGQGGSRIRFEGQGDDGTGPQNAVNRDDDRLWKAGVFYFNRDDPAVWVQKRFGVGWTVNFAQPAALVFLTGLLAVVVLILALR